MVMGSPGMAQGMSPGTGGGVGVGGGSGDVDAESLLSNLSTYIQSHSSTAAQLSQAQEQLSTALAKVAELSDKNSSLLMEKSALMEKQMARMEVRKEATNEAKSLLYLAFLTETTSPSPFVLVPERSGGDGALQGPRSPHGRPGGEGGLPQAGARRQAEVSDEALRVLCCTLKWTTLNTRFDRRAGSSRSWRGRRKI